MANINTSNAGWDIGGAHVKLAYVDQNTLCVHQWDCPLWKGLDYLENVLQAGYKALPKHITNHHVTMTGELVDLFVNRDDGVKQIIQTFSEQLPNKHTVKYFSCNGLLSEDESLQNTHLVSSVNWMASGRAVSRIHDNVIFIDIGSTTTDMLLIQNGNLKVNGLSDFERLRTGELIYTGVVRSCVNTLCSQVYYKGNLIPLIAENFSVSADVYRILDCLPAYADYGETMDGQAKDKVSSMRRLARMLGLDYTAEDADEWTKIAKYIAEQQKQMIIKPITALLEDNKKIDKIVGAGVGGFLVRNIAADLALNYVDFSAAVLPSDILFQPNASDCAPAISMLFE